MASLLDSSSDSDEEVILKNVSKREIQLSTGNSQPRNEFEKNRLRAFHRWIFRTNDRKPEIIENSRRFHKNPKKWKIHKIES